MRGWLFLSCYVAGVLACTKSETPAPTPLRIAAAADLTFAFNELGKLFEEQTHSKPVFSFGSTGQLAKQISEGAPYDIFAAANDSFVDTAISAGACLPETKTAYARGRIVVWTPDRVAPPNKLEDLNDPRFVKIAIANPDHAPYGQAAKQAFEATQTWDSLRPRIVYAENVKQTLQFAESGNVEAAVVALSLAAVTRGGHYLTIDEDLHKPIDQALAICKRGEQPALAQTFVNLLKSPQGRALMNRYGFNLPGEMVARQ